MSEVTQILGRIQEGDPQAGAQLLPFIYDELRRLAAGHMANEASGHTLTATALVHEAYLRLVGPTDEARWANRGHFFAAAAEAMRRILVEQARRKHRVRHGGGMNRIDFDDACANVSEPSDDLLALDEALTQLASLNPARAEVVKLRFFAGLTMPEVAQALGISLPTAERYWAFARTWLFAELRQEQHKSE